MENFVELLHRYGKEKEFSQGEELCRQGAPSDGAYYLESGRLGVYRVEQDTVYSLSEILPGELAGEIGATTGWSRTATVKAEENSRVIHISEADFRRVLSQEPALAAEIVCQLGKRLTYADTDRITLDRSYRWLAGQTQELSFEKEQLEELLRLREDLVDMIIHDLRNPLGVISCGVELLERELVVKTELEYADSLMTTVKNALRRMQRLVDTLLDIARLEEGKMVLQLTPLDIASLIEKTIAGERHLIKGRDVVLEQQLSESLPLVLADHDVLQRVLINLLDNALKFTPNGGCVTVKAQLDPEGVRVEVIDTGPGIPAKERKHIFEKFTQVRREVKDRAGAGLGLPFCQMAVEAHGGRIWIESGPDGKGSCFVFILPEEKTLS